MLAIIKRLHGITYDEPLANISPTSSNMYSPCSVDKIANLDSKYRAPMRGTFDEAFVGRDIDQFSGLVVVILLFAVDRCYGCGEQAED